MSPDLMAIVSLIAENWQVVGAAVASAFVVRFMSRFC